MGNENHPWSFDRKPKIQYRFNVNQLDVAIKFADGMDTTLLPASEKLLVIVDDVTKPIADLTWADGWTLIFTVPDIATLPENVLVGYDGPDEGLQTMWENQWRAWTNIPATEITPE